MKLSTCEKTKAKILMYKGVALFVLDVQVCELVLHFLKPLLPRDLPHNKRSKNNNKKNHWPSKDYLEKQKITSLRSATIELFSNWMKINKTIVMHTAALTVSSLGWSTYSEFTDLLAVKSLMDVLKVSL